MRFKFSLPLAALTGALTAYLSFAPIGWWWFAFIGMGALAYLVRRVNTFKAGAVLGFVFGLAYFVAGVSWVRVSMHEFGNMPLSLAWFSAVLFCGFLAIYPMLACAITAWAQPKSRIFFAFVFASAWAFTEYLRAHLFTGFEWLSLGASQAPNGIALSAQVFGVFGASFLIVFLACNALMLVQWASAKIVKSNDTSDADDGLGIAPLALAISLSIAPIIVLAVVGPLDFASTATKPIRVSLLQGNIEQSLKWNPERFQATLNTYERLVREANGELIILPETAIPRLLEFVPPEYIERLQRIAKEKNANLLVGVLFQEKERYYNAAMSLGVEPSQSYRKVHLVPFGETMPLQGLLGWFYRNLQIPMSTFSSGDNAQPLMKLNGQTLGISICYEDAFARDVHRSVPDATLLVNISNDAWFGKSAAAEQHLQLAQQRAIEFARPMLRANNTGVTAVIDDKGRITQRLASFETGILETTVQGANGYTPYVAWGDLPILLICLAGLGVGAAQRLRRGK